MLDVLYYGLIGARSMSIGAHSMLARARSSQSGMHNIVDDLHRRLGVSLWLRLLTLPPLLPPSPQKVSTNDQQTERQGNRQTRHQ